MAEGLSIHTKPEGERKRSGYMMETFLGVPNASSTNEGWLSKYRSVVLPLMQNVVDTSCAEKTISRIGNLPQYRPRSVGEFDQGLIVKNQKNDYDPHAFFMILEHADYSLKNPEWTKFLPPLPMSPVEAHQVISTLLNVYFSLYSKKTQNALKSDEKINFGAGQLVIVKVIKDGKFQMRRGVIQSCTLDNYKVFMLDFGESVKCSSDFLLPLPKPFHTIAPLAVKCSLHGISPVYLSYSEDVRKLFSEFLVSLSDSNFLVNVLSDFELIKDMLYVSVDVINESFSVSQPNFTQFLIDQCQVLQWNLFPARPRLMGGDSLATVATPNDQDQETIPKPTVLYRDALFLTNCYLPTTGFARLPLVVLDREHGNLWTSRQTDLSSLYGTDVHLTISVDKSFGNFTPALPPSPEESQTSEFTLNVPDLRKSMEQREEDAMKLAEEDEQRMQLYKKFHFKAPPRMICLARFPQDPPMNR